MAIANDHYHFKLLYNKWDSQHKRDLNPAEIDEILNKAQDIYIEQTYSGFNSKQVGFENTQQRIDDLSHLVIKCPSNIQQELSPSLSTLKNISKFNLEDLQFPYLHLIRANANLRRSSDNCTTSGEVMIVQHDDLNRILKDTFKQPSFNWKRVVGVFGRSGTSATDLSSLYIYTDDTFSVDSICIEYLKKPDRVSIGGYPDISGNIKTATNFEFPDHVILQIIDLAVREAQRIISDPEGFQLASNLYDNNE